MKKLLTILLSFTTIASFGQTTVIYNTLKNDGATFGGKDTVVKYPLAYAVNKYFTGYGTWGSLPDTVRSFFSVDTSGSSGGSTYNPSTGVFHIPSYAGGGGSSTTVQQDSSLLIASTLGYINTITSPMAGRKGLILRNTNTTASSSPAILFQNYYTGLSFWRVYSSSQNLYFDYSPDTLAWTNALQLNFCCGSIGFMSTPDLHVTSASGTVTGTNFVISNAGFGVFGSSTLLSSVAWDFRPRSSSTYGISFPHLTTTNRNNYPTALLGTSGVISNAGSGYTNGSYSGKSFTNISGSGTGGVISITVAGGVVTSVTCSAGTGYKAGDVETVAAATIGGTGSGFTYTLTKTVGDQNDGTLIYDSTLHKMVYWSTGSHANMVLIDSETISGNLTIGSSSLTLVAGNDYIFNGTTATYTLPAVSSTAIGRANIIYIKNQGSGSITLNSATGSQIYTSSAQSSITIVAGAACQLLPGTSYFNVMYNQ